MKSTSRLFLITFLCFLVAPLNAFAADFLGDALKGLPQLPGIMSSPKGPAAGGLDDPTIASGLKEALSIGTKNAIRSVSNPDGYLGNEAIRILLPDKVQKAAEFLSRLGYQQEVDEFIRSMNRAAEKAAPRAAAHFSDALRAMTIDDVRKILSGGDTAATDYFQSKTSRKLYEDFKPSIAESMNQVGVARSYNALLGRIPVVSFAKPESVDLDHHITSKALDGLFWMVGQEERKIRTNPVARTTDLLRKVFGQ
jgi:hypothetical protein